MAPRILLAILLVFIATSSKQASPSFYYITPTVPNLLCPLNEPCLKLSQFVSLDRYANNTSLIFLPGNHSLNSQLIFKNLVNITLSGVVGSSRVVCTGPGSGVTFDGSTNSRIRGLSICECNGPNNRAVQVVNVQNFSITNSEFVNNGGSESSTRVHGGALFIESSQNVFITNTHFNNNRALNGGAVNTVNSSVRYVFSYFTQNNASDFGGAIAAGYGQTYIQKCRFVKNRVDLNGFSGGAVSAVNESLFITESEFDCNKAPRYGGSLYAISKSSLYVQNCQFKNGTSRSGAAIAILEGKMYIHNSSFTGNNASLSGGALYFVQSIVSIANCLVNQNHAYQANRHSNETETITFGGGVYVGGVCALLVNNTHIVGNYANGYGGGVYVSLTSNFSAWNTQFYQNHNLVTERDGTPYGGGAISASGNVAFFDNCLFSENEAVNGGAIYNYFSSLLSINSCTFERNIGWENGGALSTCELCFTSIDNSRFHSNTANVGAAIFAQGSRIVSNSYLRFENNSCTSIGVVYLHHCKVKFNGGCLFFNNTGSLFVFVTGITFQNETNFLNNSKPLLSDRSLIKTPPVDFTEEGGGVTLIQSIVVFWGKVLFTHNQAQYGGGMLISESTVYIYIASSLTMFRNTAFVSGGAVYISQSTLFLGGNISITGNTASENGGGVIAASTTIKIQAGQIRFFQNQARHGGGLYMEEDSRLLIEKLNTQTTQFNFIEFSENTADFGGAMFVRDDTNSGVCGEESTIPQVGLLNQCFFQILRLYSTIQSVNETQRVPSIIKSLSFTNNTGRIRGSSLFGELFDRCALSPFAEIRTVYPRTTFKDAFEVFTLTAQLDSVDPVSSNAVQVCFCERNTFNCSDKLPVMYIRKGHTFRVYVVAVDQVQNPVSANIYASLSSSAGFNEGQTSQSTLGECTALEYNIYSPHKNETLLLFADGPCMDKGISRQNITISFAPCTCLIGFQPSESNSTCECMCDTRLSPFITNCSSSKDILFKHSDFWIDFTNETNTSGFIIYKYCPYDYCRSTLHAPVPVNLNVPGGDDQQCAYNRSGILCGSCAKGLSLVLGSSRCLECPNTFLSLLIPFAMAGVVLVMFLLMCNLTVATGTINGLIFYANVVVANRPVFLPFETPNVLSIFISWINLDLGIEMCFYNGMDTYAKTLLQLVFPTYVLSLVVLLIVICKYSERFANLVGKRNPIATLATLILLCYAKFLRFLIAGLSFGHLKLPNGSQEMIWLPDANIPFLANSHTPRFLMVAVIVTVGLLYTTLLLFEKCLRKCSKRKLLRCLNNTKLHAFMDAYYAPHNPQHCYWVGLLLLVRITLYLHAVGFNSDPTLEQKATLLAIIGVVFFLILIKQWKVRIYKNWMIDLLETSFLINLGVFAAGTYHTLSTKGNQLAVVYVSLSIAFATFLIICIYHTYAYIIKPDSCNKLVSHCCKLLCKCRERRPIDGIYQDIDENGGHGNEPYVQLQTGNELQQPVCWADNELREPALDILAPITTNDRLIEPKEELPSFKAPVTYSVINGRPDHRRS